MINVALSIIAVNLFHTLDAVYTLLLISKARETWDNPEEMEMNYHRYFFKKFGLNKGAIISFSMSLLYFNAILIYAFFYGSELAVGMILGIALVPAMINIRSYYSHDEVTKKLKRKKRRWDNGTDFK